MNILTLKGGKMNNSSIKKPLMLAGLIINIIAFAILAISCLISLVAFIALIPGTSSDPTDIADSIVILMIVLLLFMLAFCIAGVVVASVGITRTKLEGAEFSKKRGAVIASFVFDCLLGVLILIGFASGFDVLSFIILLALIVAGTLIMIDLARNSKVAAADANTNNTTTNTATVETQQATEAKVEEQKAAEEPENKE